MLAVFAFFATLVGNLLSFNHRGYGAVLSALLFAAIFVFWTYYPHGLPLPTRLESPRPVAAAPPAAPAAPVKPANPVTDITPPKNPVTDVTPPARQ
jgi:hypothetical protein